MHHEELYRSLTDFLTDASSGNLSKFFRSEANLFVGMLLDYRSAKNMHWNKGQSEILNQI